MMTKPDSKIPAHVDLENGILHGLLKQVRWEGHYTGFVKGQEPPLTKVWCCEISPQQAQEYTKFLRDIISPIEAGSLAHLKRIKKDNRSSNLHIIICDKGICDTGDAVERLLVEHRVLKSLGVFVTSIPSCCPLTKEQSLDWSLSYWPIAWKGNPNHRYLSSITLDPETEKQRISRLQELYSSQIDDATRDSTLAVIMVDEDSCERPVVETSSCDQGNPFEHAVMKAVGLVAKNERDSRTQNKKFMGNYLCQGMAVYATHEPCVMCCMALVHSRISRITYLQSSLAGGLESNYQLGDMEGLNWRFDIWRWVGPSVKVAANDRDY